jgi:hypothetical protein
MSEAPAEDCELVRRGIVGLRLDDVEATNVVAFFFDLLPCPFLFSSFVLELAESLELTLGAVAVVEVVVPLSLAPSSSTSDPVGDANRAVGRGPEAEGPLGFFRMGCKVLVEEVIASLFGFNVDTSEAACMPCELDSEDFGEGYSGPLAL